MNKEFPVNAADIQRAENKSRRSPVRKRRCESPGCGILFYPRVPWQRYHDLACGDRERHRLARERARARVNGKDHGHGQGHAQPRRYRHRRRYRPQSNSPPSPAMVAGRTREKLRHVNPRSLEIYGPR